MLDILLMAVVGGGGTVYGPVVGVTVTVFVLPQPAAHTYAASGPSRALRTVGCCGTAKTIIEWSAYCQRKGQQHRLQGNYIGRKQRANSARADTFAH